MVHKDTLEKEMDDSTPAKNETKEIMTDVEWENRRLCSNGNCIGVIGIDGCCNVCGKPFAGKLPKADMPEPVTDPSPVVSHETSPAPNDEKPSADASNEDTDVEWKNRRLCSDGNCIGVIGIDGCCKVCGKPYTP